jgi:tetratricopeptide (TPR) repeat protein
MPKRARARAGLTDRKTSRPNGLHPQADAASPAARPLAPPPGRQPSAEAVSLFEKGMKALQRHAYGEAADLFRGVISGFPAEGALCERSHVYLSLCERELRRQPAAPKTVEERLTAATAALNDDDDAGAERLARSVLEDVPQHDLALYLLAAVEARRGEMDGALQLLERAIAISPEIRAQAKHDADFEDLRDLEAFRQLIEIPLNPGPYPRRARRGRIER